MKKKLNIYTEEFKWRVVQKVLNGKLTKEHAKEFYGIKSNCAILYWMRKFSGQDNYRQGGVPFGETKAMKENKEKQALEQRIRELEKQLQREQLRADLWQKMVEIAEEHLNIDIKKKYGAQQFTV